MGVAGFRLVANDAHDVGLTALIVDGVAHGFAIDGQRGIVLGKGFIPSLEGLIETGGVDPDEDLTDGGETGDDIAALDIRAAETFSGLLA